MAVLIPKLLHRIWLGGPMPEEFRRYGETWRTHHPEWTMLEWNEGNMPPLRNQSLYDSAPSLVDSSQVPRMRSDLARMEILERFGGMYVDTDFECLAPIDPLIDGLEMFAAEEQPGLIANGLMGCTPGHPFMSRMIDTAAQSVKARPGQKPWRTVGPEHLTRTARSTAGLSLLPRERIYPYHHTQLLPDGSPPEIGPDAVCHHVWASIRRSVSVIVPFRPSDPFRAQNWQWVQAYYRRFFPSWQVVEADEPGEPFSKAQAIRDAVSRSYGDVLVITDADLIVTDLRSAVAAVSTNRTRWAIPHTNVHRLSWDATRAVLGGVDPRTLANRTAEHVYRGLVGGGILVIDREAFERCPPDPRFRGWGGEDEAWGLALRSFFGEPWRGAAGLLHLWHPPAPRMKRDLGNDGNERLVARYRNAKMSHDMASLVAEHRGDMIHHG